MGKKRGISVRNNWLITVVIGIILLAIPIFVILSLMFTSDPVATIEPTATPALTAQQEATEDVVIIATHVVETVATLDAVVTDSLTPQAMQPTETPTTTITPDPLVVAQQATADAVQDEITPTIQADNDTIGNAEIYPFYDDRVDFPNVMEVELQLILYELVITPTPAGQPTVLPANTDIPRPPVDPNPSPLITPRPARIQDDLQGVPPYVIAELECSETVFSGCEEQAVRDIQLRDVNGWIWRVQPLVEQPSRQSMSLVLYEANPDGTKISNTPIYRHDFEVEVGDSFSLQEFFAENTAALITAAATVLAALIGGIFLVLQQTKSNTTGSSETNMGNVEGDSVNIGGTINYHGNVTINQKGDSDEDDNDSSEGDKT